MPEKVGRYRILGELGRGSMGTVYRAEDTLIGRVVALKTVGRPGVSSPPQEHEAYARFLREARAAGTFLHPHVVTVFDVGEDAASGLSFIAMELVQGDALDKILRKGKRLDWATIRKIGWQTASALKAAHDAGIVHRDIKPANLILTAAGDVKVADFGIAKMANAAMTQDGSLLGSPGYMSPEQVRAAGVDHRSDIYSLGIVLYELVTLKPAFPGSNVFEVITLVANGLASRPRDLRPDVPADLEAVILRATTRDRDKRFGSAAEMMTALEPPTLPAPPPPHVTIIQPPAAPPVGPAGKASGPAAGKSAASRAAGAGRNLALVSAALLVLIGVLTWAVVGRRSSSDAQQPLDAGLVPTPGEASPAPVDTPASAEPTPDLPVAELPAPTEPPTAEATTAPVAATPRRRPTSPAPLAAPRNRFSFEVTHAHSSSVCRGRMTIDEFGVVYDSIDKDEDDFTWTWSDLNRVKTGDDGLIEISSNDRKLLGLKRKGYRFRAVSEKLPAGLPPFIEQRKPRD